MKRFLLITTLGALLFTGGCRALPFLGGDDTPAHQTEGGTVKIEKNLEGELVLVVEQPANAEAPAIVEVTLPTGDTIRASTGSSREDKNFGLVAKLGQYKVFTYVGAGVCVLGVGLLVASFWIPLIPKTAGLMVFAGGAVTAYLSTAIPQYGPYALGLSVVGAVIWWIHRDAAKKHPDQFDRKKIKELRQK